MNLTCILITVYFLFFLINFYLLLFYGQLCGQLFHFHFHITIQTPEKTKHFSNHTSQQHPNTGKLTNQFSSSKENYYHSLNSSLPPLTKQALNRCGYKVDSFDSFGYHISICNVPAEQQKKKTGALKTRLLPALVPFSRDTVGVRDRDNAGGRSHVSPLPHGNFNLWK